MLQVLKFIPSWLWLIPILLSVATLIISYLPQAKPFKNILKLVALILMVLSIFICGMQYANGIWQQAARELEQKVQLAEVQAELANKITEQKVVVKTQVVKERGQAIVEYVDREIVKYNNQCILPTEFITAHNRAAEPPK